MGRFQIRVQQINCRSTGSARENSAPLTARFDIIKGQDSLAVGRGHRSGNIAAAIDGLNAARRNLK
tara:strand:+ start:725 stop:922 length:198 start_codon:yes stop_codon:yes gene_type:complete